MSDAGPAAAARVLGTVLGASRAAVKIVSTIGRYAATTHAQRALGYIRGGGSPAKKP